MSPYLSEYKIAASGQVQVLRQLPLTEGILYALHAFPTAKCSLPNSSHQRAANK